MKKINFHETIQTIANLGVVAGINFLAFEVRQNSDAIRTSTSQDMASEQAEFNRTFIDPEIARIFV